VGGARKIHGVIFSDLGVASRFMALDWVQQALTQCLGFAPFPATLNVRPAGAEDAAAWRSIQEDARYYAHMPGHEGACRARVYHVAISANRGGAIQAAVLLPEVANYPKDKLEIVAPLRLKDALGLKDGDRLTLEFFH
jgi:CTP-dependent riboflavin kinase